MFIEERFKLRAEGRKFGRHAWASPVATGASAMTAWAVLFGAGAAFVKLFGH